jgi:formylmethanofuran dehydrogenase subunit B
MNNVTENMTCTFCGCLCDDITVEVADGRVVKAKKACANGAGIFKEYDPSPSPPLVDGKEVQYDEAIARAAEILNQAKSPMIYGLSSMAVEAQRKAVTLADKLGAVIDTTSSVCHGPTGMGMMEVGEATCTLGEIRNRADLLVFWGCNPAASHMRHFARFSMTPKAGLNPNGRKDRTIYAVDVRPTPTTQKADHFLQISLGYDYEALTTLRALIAGKKITQKEIAGQPLEAWQELAERMKACRYGVVFMGMGITMSRGRQHNVSELFTLVTELNKYTRFSVLPMRGHGNVAGADQVMTWQCGYPFAVSFAKGIPQFGPGEFTAVDMLSNKHADAAVILASDPAAHFPRAAAEYLAKIPTITLDCEVSLTAKVSKVYFPTACYGVDAPGTCYRMDNVPIRLRAAMEAKRPTDEKVLTSLIEAVKSC